ncbi:MAG TPA: bifunctional serine/threonine-protein kinase/formylglycine-generating enzyme family protein [Polyangiaceae bacterium]
MPPPDTLNLLGTTIADKYAVESVVGEGGFAIVYKATHLLWKRPVAVKVFKALGDVAAEHRGKLLEEFIREGALLADLSERSAAIVQARDVGTLKTSRGDEVPYMVLEWLEGATLESVILAEKDKGLPPRTIAEAVRLLDPAAEALALAHAQGIAHRDVKPANVFVLGDPRSPAVTVKLLDFGIAKVVQDAQKMAGSFAKTSGQITSFTPAYGAPEQFSRAHGATGPWTDAFALALVVVEVLTQKDPLDGDDFMQLAYASSNPAARPTPRTRGVAVSDAVEQVFARALAVRVQDRFQSAGDFWNALRAAVDMPPLRRVTTNPIVFQNDPTGPLSSQPTVPVDSLRASAPVSAAAAGAAPAPRKGAVLAMGIGAVALLAGIAGVVALNRKGAGATPATGAASSAPALAPSAGAAPAADVGSCPEGMIAVPGGEFFMGSDDGPPFEQPSHHVRLAPFCIDRTEVTVAKYKACSDRGACKRAGTVNDWEGIKEHEKKVFDPLCNVREPAKLGNHPINCVDWEMADQYCASQGEGARLPTEAEWEFAARGPDGRQYPWGDEPPSPAYLNACGTECVAWGKAHQIEETAMYAADDGFPNTSPVGSFPGGKSRYGVEDVAGNVWEWVGDWYAPYAAGKKEGDMPVNPKGPASGAQRVIRGGAWNGEQPSWVRPTFRFRDAPTKRSYGIGFRCAKSR